MGRPAGERLGRVQVAGLRPGDYDRWVGKGELARRLGRSGSGPGPWSGRPLAEPPGPAPQYRLGFGAPEHGVPQPWQRMIRLAGPTPGIRVLVTCSPWWW
ncbi:MAG: hypothetical protein U0800_06945 [Isosphaeraceae bacterium]